MAYIDVTYVEDRVRERLLIELTDDTVPPTGAIVTAKITKAITTIEARFNNVLRKTYTLPLTETATPDTTAYDDSVELLKGLVLRNVMFQLHVNANMENIPQEYIDAKLELEDYEAGRRLLSLYGCTLVDSLTNLIQSNKISTDKIYTSDLLGTY